MRSTEKPIILVTPMVTVIMVTVQHKVDQTVLVLTQAAETETVVTAAVQMATAQVTATAAIFNVPTAILLVPVIAPTAITVLPATALTVKYVPQSIVACVPTARQLTVLIATDKTICKTTATAPVHITVHKVR